MSTIASVGGFPFSSVAFTTPSRRKSVVAMASPPPLATKTATTTVGRGLYGVLGLREESSLGEIKAAYRSLAKRWHPDVSGDKGAGGFLEIQRAYSTLSHPDERERYDRSIGRLSLGIRRGEKFQTTRRWETDQCW